MVDNIGAVNGMMGNSPARKIKQSYQFQQPAKIQDTVELTSDVMTVRGVDKVRMDKIMEIRQQINDGTYLTEEKLDKALDNALDQMISGL